jgi:hypothetical protein
MEQAAQLFSLQDGLATTTQLAERGVGESVVRQRIATGEWVRQGPGLVGLPIPRTWRRRARAAVLLGGPDVVLSHGTAGRMHHFDGFDRFDEIHLTVGGTGRRSAGDAVMHRSRLLTPSDRLVVGGLPVVIRPVALLQVASHGERDITGRALDGMLRDGDRPLWIRQVAERWRGHGVAGPAVVLGLLDERVDGTLPRSWFQRLAKRVLAARGIHMVDEHPVHHADGRLLAELDLAMPELRIGVECQSWHWHSTPTARAHDARRKRLLRLLGWELVEVWWSDLERVDEVAEEVVFLATARQRSEASAG